MKTTRLIATFLLLGLGVMASVIAGRMFHNRHPATADAHLFPVVHAAGVSAGSGDTDLHAEAVQLLQRYTLNAHPVWEAAGWSTLHQLRQACSTAGPLNEADVEKVLEDELRSPPQLNGTHSSGQPLQAVYFNPAASTWIKSNNCLANADTLRHQLSTDLQLPTASPCPAGNLILPPPRSPEIAPCPPPLGSAAKPGDDPPGLLVAVKTVWQVITPLPQPSRLQGFLQLKTGAMPPHTRSTVLFPPVSVDASNPADATCHSMPPVPGGTAVYSLNCFYTRRLSPQAADEMNLPSSYKTILNGPCRHSACYLVLVGMHVISNESPTWTWRTYWWDALNSGLTWRAGTNGAQDLQENKWTFFTADEAVSDAGTVAHPNIKPIANPYIEGQVSGGMRSNCVGCHQYAAYSPTNLGTSMIACASSSNTAISVATQTTYFSQSLKTHFLWTLAGLPPPTSTATNSGCQAANAVAAHPGQR